MKITHLSFSVTEEHMTWLMTLAQWVAKRPYAARVNGTFALRVALAAAFGAEVPRNISNIELDTAINQVTLELSQ